jgi:hypothetical protein
MKEKPPHPRRAEAGRLSGSKLYIILHKMKSINITGKHNIDKINEIGNERYQAIRKHMSKFDETEYDNVKQLTLLRDILDNTINDNISIKSLLKSELIHKIQGYKGQDLKKELHDTKTLITLEDVLFKLCASNLSCFYCSKPILVLYKNVREPLQWTLDRLDNDLSHTKENTCIACLKCNLQRRVMHVDKFTFTKKLKINKL